VSSNSSNKKIERADSANTYQSRPDKIDRGESPADKRWAALRSVVRIDYDVCDTSGVCAMVCPEEVLEFKEGHTHIVKPAACTECWICVENCVSGAIEIG
jgi:MinD superfamily P-loop ATPase